MCRLVVTLKTKFTGGGANLFGTSLRGVKFTLRGNFTQCMGEGSLGQVLRCLVLCRKRAKRAIFRAKRAMRATRAGEAKRAQGSKTTHKTCQQITHNTSSKTTHKTCQQITHKTSSKTTHKTCLKTTQDKLGASTHKTY